MGLSGFSGREGVGGKQGRKGRGGGGMSIRRFWPPCDSELPSSGSEPLSPVITNSFVVSRRHNISKPRVQLADARLPDTSVTERLDYFAATLTISFSLLYSLLRIFSLQTPLGTSRLAFPIAGLVACLVLAHFTYLLSFPPGSFPYGYHSAFNLCLAIGHNLLWIIWSASFYLPLPSFNLGNYSLGLPYPYPPNDPLTTARPKDAATPISLVALTTLAMSFELLDFAPLFRMMDAHSLWHASTIPLAIAWWTFLCSDAVEVEGTMLGARGVSSVGVGVDEKMPLSGGSQTPGTPSYAQLAAGVGVQKGRSKSPGRSPGRGEKGERVD